VATIVFVMVVVGGITRLTESGLSIVRWQPISGVIPPLNAEQWAAEFRAYQATPEYQKINSGMTLEAFKGIFFWEYLHRQIGRLIGLAMILPLAWFAWKRAIPDGYGSRLIALAVDYTGQRVQFGVPIGSFQAVKHALADVKVKLEYARPLVYRAADSVARARPKRSVQVSMAKVAAAEAALRGARAALQAHGAIGYTWEQDVHIWMRRAWSLDYTWGSQRFHRARTAEFALAPGAPLGAGHTFS